MSHVPTAVLVSLLVSLLTLRAKGLKVAVNDVIYPGTCLVSGPFASDSLVVSYVIDSSCEASDEGCSFNVVFERSPSDNLTTAMHRQRSGCTVSEEDVIAEVSSFGQINTVNYTAIPFFFDSRFTIMLSNNEGKAINVTGFISLAAPTMEEVIASWIWYVLGVAVLAVATSIITVVKMWLKERTTQITSRASIPTQLRVY